MKITLYLMSKKGLEVLKALIQANFKSLISEIIVGRDNHIDNDYADDIIELCKLHDIRHFERNENFEINSDYSVAISWRWLIPMSVSRLIVLHDSLLPKYRGFAPLVSMLFNQEKEFGVTAIFAGEEYDKGEIIAQSATPVNYPIKIAEAIDLISENYVELVTGIFATLAKGELLTSVPQDETQATYSLWRDEDDYLIDWTMDSKEILNLVNAVGAPYKGAVAYMNGKYKVRILEAEIFPDVKIENRNSGKVIFINEGSPIVVCGSGLLKIVTMTDDKTKADCLPLKHFRTRFTAFNT